LDFPHPSPLARDPPLGGGEGNSFFRFLFFFVLSTPPGCLEDIPFFLQKKQDPFFYQGGHPFSRKENPGCAFTFFFFLVEIWVFPFFLGKFSIPHLAVGFFPRVFFPGSLYTVLCFFRSPFGNQTLFPTFQLSFKPKLVRFPFPARGTLSGHLLFFFPSDTLFFSWVPPFPYACCRPPAPLPCSLPFPPSNQGRILVPFPPPCSFFSEGLVCFFFLLFFVLSFFPFLLTSDFFFLVFRPALVPHPSPWLFFFFFFPPSLGRVFRLLIRFARPTLPLTFGPKDPLNIALFLREICPTFFLSQGRPPPSAPRSTGLWYFFF